jgi:hypothetical protein
MKDKMEKTWAEGLNPSYKAMTDKETIFFIAGTLLEVRPAPVEQVKFLEEEFLIKILLKRIEVFKLPISFDTSGKMALLSFVDRPGAVVALLIDCLNAYEGQVINAEKLAGLYPTGFYDEDTLSRYIDSYLKPKKVKWSELY